MSIERRLIPTLPAVRCRQDFLLVLQQSLITRIITLHRCVQLQRSRIILLQEKLFYLCFVDTDDLRFQCLAILISRVARLNRPVQRGIVERREITALVEGVLRVEIHLLPRSRRRRGRGRNRHRRRRRLSSVDAVASPQVLRITVPVIRVRSIVRRSGAAVVRHTNDVHRAGAAPGFCLPREIKNSALVHVNRPRPAGLDHVSAGTVNHTINGIFLCAYRFPYAPQPWPYAGSLF